MSKKQKLFLFSLIILALLIACCFMFFAFTIITADLSVSGDDTFSSGSTDQTVAVIDVDGVITSLGASDFWGNELPGMVTDTVDKLERAKNDDNVKAVLIRVDSPGGEVYGTRIIYNKIKEVQEEGKVVVVLMESQAASGGYYISAPADWIVASEMTLTGSIGVRFSGLDLSGLYEKVGVEEVEVVNSEGDLKVLTDLADKNSEGYKVLQSVADDYYDNFVTVVAEGRGLDKSYVISIADGRVYSGMQAYDNSLIDEIGESKEAVAKVAELADLDDPNFVVYDSSLSGFSFASSMLKLISPELDIINRVSNQPGIQGYYLLTL
ncbi:signal peptide peptidase SppA [Candidatus Dojkabacteria bacterium]|uniref:Signal peptide peptidase SppA n=1 Tax=Candidatus Dojkabacteria bacterium TaxID=2099670 RepID=A0A955L4N5_9BACT|nr:signal peptide peptidase SppA [Candidatus Dojkabacteria bacterium]